MLLQLIVVAIQLTFVILIYLILGLFFIGHLLLEIPDLLISVLPEVHDHAFDVKDVLVNGLDVFFVLAHPIVHLRVVVQDSVQVEQLFVGVHSFQVAVGDQGVGLALEPDGLPSAIHDYPHALVEHVDGLHVVEACGIMLQLIVVLPELLGLLLDFIDRVVNNLLFLLVGVTIVVYEFISLL